MEKTKKLLLSEYDDCFALLAFKDIEAGDFMADMKGIYEAPEIDGFIGFLKVVACTKPKGNLPLLDENKIDIPKNIRYQKFWEATVELNDVGSPKVENGFVNLINIQQC
jgi:hypothetical protein